MATRLYLPSTGTAPLSALAFNVGWEDQSIGARLPTSTVKAGSAMATVSFLDNNAADKDILFRQYQSDRIAAQTIAAQTVKFQIRGALTSAGDGMFTAIHIRVVAGDGSSDTGTILAITRDGTLLTTTLTNRQFSATTSQVVANNGDRIVIEIGTGGDPSGSNDHDSDLRVGDAAASDLAEDDTTTDDNNPWVEFANTIDFNFVEAVASIADQRSRAAMRLIGVGL